MHEPARRRALPAAASPPSLVRAAPLRPAPVSAHAELEDLEARGRQKVVGQEVQKRRQPAVEGLVFGGAHLVARHAQRAAAKQRLGIRSKPLVQARELRDAWVCV